MLDKRKSSTFVIAAFVALVASVNGQQANRVADADPRYIATQAGQTINLLCRVAQPVSTCRFQIPGEPVDIKLNPTWPARNDNFQYYGNGLDQGQCGVTIKNVREDYHGNATCILDPNDGGTDAVGVIDIVIAKAPQLPQITVDQRELEAGEELEAECTSIDGRPAANITWYLNDQPLGPGEIETVDSSTTGTTYYTVYSKLRYMLKPQDHTQNLICRAYHPGYTPEGFTDTRLNLNVNFRPVALPETIISGLELGSSANIGPITIQANPRPSIKWTVDGVVINQGEQTQRYVANEPVQTGVGMWNVSLTVIELTLQDTTRTYKLRANNAFGTTDYSIRIGGSQDVAGTGMGIVTIVAISIVALFVLVIVALIVVAKVTKRWCFAGDSMHPNGPDSEAQIAPEDDKVHEHYEPAEKVSDDDEHPELPVGDGEVKTTNGKPKGNTSV